MADARAIFSLKIRKCRNLLITRGWIFGGAKIKRGTRLTRKPMHLKSTLEL